MVIPSFFKSTTCTATAILSLLLLDGVQGLVPAVSSNNTVTASPSINGTQGLTGLPPCDALIAAGLSHAVHLASSNRFQPLVEDYFALTSRRAPWCFVLPSTPAEVSKVITTLRDAGEGAGDWHIAIRAGGHAGSESNNIAKGVTIDLSQLNTTTYNKETNVASYQTGARWGSVYTELAKHNVLVPGGREDVVGVGGFTLGGGVSWYAPRVGFTCDNAVNFEVVLANGEIVNANKTSNRDLFKALKGGISNFGIVTRFDLEALPATNLTVESRVFNITHKDEIIKAVTGLAHLDRSFQDNAAVPMVTYAYPGGTTVLVKQVNTANNWNTTAFDELNSIPAIQIVKPKESVNIVQSVMDTSLPSGGRNAGQAYTIAADPRMMSYALDQHAALVETLKSTLGADKFTTLADFQPFPGYIADNSVARGGNMIGLSNCTNRLICVLSATMLDKEKGEMQYPVVLQEITSAVQRILAYAKSLGMEEEFVYLNYADASQDPLGKYGEKNVKFMKKVAKKYDAKGFFQERVPGGFKISRVSS